ncbi:hypothetical protein D1007_43043 [Hordeum vulgare]|nr:hypothetical protein D1007_43043 [Hordeum vulgare]
MQSSLIAGQGGGYHGHQYQQGPGDQSKMSGRWGMLSGRWMSWLPKSIDQSSIPKSWPDISKFQTKPFPLYDKLGDLYDGHIAEDDLHMYDDPRDAAQSDGPRGATQSDGPIYGTQSDVTRAGAPGGSNKKLVKEPNKKKRDDLTVEVIANYVEIKQKQAEEEFALFAGSKSAQQFTITKCIAVMHKMESISHGERAAAYKVFKNVENHEIFLSAPPKMK